MKSNGFSRIPFLNHQLPGSGSQATQCPCGRRPVLFVVENLGLIVFSSKVRWSDAQKSNRRMVIWV